MNGPNYKDWIVFEAVLPIAIAITLWWPIGSFVLDLPHLGWRIFSSADLMLVAGLLLFGVANEADQIDRQLEAKNLGLWIRFAQGIGLLIFLVYGAFKIGHLSYSFPAASSQAVNEDIIGIALFSGATAFFSIAFSVFVKVRATKALVNS